MEDLATEFNGLLAEPLKRGQLIDIDVKAAKNPKTFHISVAKDKLNQKPDAEIGLHVVVKFDRNVITVHREEEEAVSAPCNSSGVLGDDIKVNILMSDTSFHISLNGEHKLQMFYHDDAIDQLKAIQIGGDIKLITRIDHRKIYPRLWPPSSFVQYYPTAMALSNDIPIRFKPGHLMVLTGRCYGSPGDFFINMKHGHNETQILHLNVMFQYTRVSRYACNPTDQKFFGHDYVDDETHGGFPFDFNKSFKIGIACKEKAFLIAVNGAFLCSYAYRDPENRHPNGIASRPYTNVLSNIVGMKVFQRDGLGVKFTEVDHIQLDNPECIHFERYTKNDCGCSERAQCSKLP